MMYKKTITLFCSLSCLLTVKLVAQCAPGSPTNPSDGSSNATIGTEVWNSAGNILLSNNTHSVATAPVLGNNTQYLVATGFGFTIPATAVICGIQVEIEKHASGLLQQVSDNSVKIVKGGIVTGTEEAQAGIWPETDSTSTYGGASSLWGTTWTPADINDNNFGACISANLSGLSALPSAYVDQIRITIYYDNILPVELLRFDAQCAGSQVALTWAVASETNNDYFTIERTTGSAGYETIATINGAGNSTQFTAYSFTDTDPLPGVSYYRLKQTDFNGAYEYFNAVAVSCRPVQTVQVYPNPATDHIRIRFDYMEKEQYKLTLSDAYGQPVYAAENVAGGQLAIDRQQLGNGVYFLQLRSEKDVLATGKVILE